MSYQYPNYLFPEYGGGPSSTAGADGQGSWYDVVGVPSPGAGYPTTYSADTAISHQTFSTQGGNLLPTEGADGQPLSAAAYPSNGVGDQPPDPANIRVPNQDRHCGSGRSSPSDSGRELKYVMGAPIESYESFINAEEHPLIVGRKLGDGHELQTSDGQSQSDEAPSAFMEHQFKFFWTDDKKRELLRLAKKGDLSLEQIAERLGGTTVGQCRKWLGRLKPKGGPQHEQSEQDEQIEQ